MECQKCRVKITTTYWSRHVRSLKHLKNGPDQTIPPRRRGRLKTKAIQINQEPRGRPKTKPCPDQTIPPRTPRKT